MPAYKIEAPDGREFEIEGDSPPTERELEDIYAQLGGSSTGAMAAPGVPRGGIGRPTTREEARLIAQERAVARDPERLTLVNPGSDSQAVGVKGQGAIPRALAASVGGGFTGGPARLIQDALLKYGLTTPEAVDALGVNRVAQENPGTTEAGNIIGGLIPAGRAFQGATALKRIAGAGALGAGYGASESVREGGSERITEDPGTLAKDTLTTGALSAILPAGLEAPAIVQRLLSGKIRPEAKQVLDLAKQMDIPITAAQATGSRRLGLTEKTLQNIPTSSGVMQGRQEAVHAGLAGKAENLLDASGSKLTQQAFGDKVQQALTEKAARFKATASKLYERFEKSVPTGTQIQLGRARDLAEDFITREQNKEGLGSTKLISQLRTFAGEADPTGKAIPKSTDVRTFLDIRAAVNDEINSAIKNERGEVARKLGMIKTEMDKSLSDFAKLQGGDIQKSFELANGYYGKGAKIFNDPKIKRMIEKDPGMLYDMVAQPGTVAEINTLKSAIGVNRFEPVRRAVMEKILATDGVDVFSPAKFGTSFKKFTPENLEAVFGSQKLKEIQDFWKVADSVVKMERRVGNPSGTAQNIITPSFWTGVGALTLSNPLTGVSTALTPFAVAKLYTSKTGTKILTEAVSTPADSPRAAEVLTRLSAILYEDSKPKDSPEMRKASDDLRLKSAAERQSRN